MIRACLLAGAASGLSVIAATTTTSTGDALNFDAIAGYTPVSDVIEHSELDLDMMKMEESADLNTDAGFLAAWKIYSEGENSEKTDSIRTIRGFSTSAQEKLSAEPWFQIYREYWNDAPDYADAFTSAACNGTGDFAGTSTATRAESCAKGAQYQNIWMYVVHELEDAINDCNNGELTANDGGPHAWDEGWAFYTGSTEDGSGSGVMPYALAEKRCPQFGTCTGDNDGSDLTGTSYVNAELLTLFTKGQASLLDEDCAGVETTKEEIVRLMTIPLVQGLLRYVYLADPDGGQGGEKEASELWAFSAAVLPQINNCDPAVATTIRANTDIASTGAPMSDGYVVVKEALESVYACMKIECAEVGGLLNETSGSPVTGMEVCSDSATSSTTSTGDFAAMAGYTPVSDVVEHSELDLDMAEMETSADLKTDAGFLAAWSVYADGKNSEKTDSIRTIRGFSTSAQEKLSAEPWFKIYQEYWNDAPDYADAFTSAACNGTGDFAGTSTATRAEACAKGAQYQNIWMYVVHELEDAINDCNNGELTANDGGPHAWDEGWAFYTGSTEDGTGSGVMPYALAEKRCPQFGTCTGDDDGSDLTGTSYVNAELLALFNDGQASLLDEDCEGVETTKEEIVRLMTIPLVQGLLRYVYLADPDGGQGGDKEASELWAFSAAVLPQIHNCDPDVATTVRANTDIASTDAPMSDGYVVVKEALESVYACMKIECAEVGGLLDETSGSPVTGMEVCSDSTDTDDGAIDRSSVATNNEGGGSDGNEGWVVAVPIVLIVAVLGAGFLFLRRRRARAAQQAAIRQYHNDDLHGFDNATATAPNPPNP